MTDPSGLGSGSHLTFHGPLSGARADRLAAELAARKPAKVVDYGCGWGELLLRILAAAPEAGGVGIDVHAPDLDRGRTAAAERGLSGRVDFVEGPAAEHLTEAGDDGDDGNDGNEGNEGDDEGGDGRADIVISCGAYHAFGTIPEALDVLRGTVRPGGVLLFGAEIWDRTPTDERLAAMWPGMTLDSCLHLPDLVEAATAAGFRPLRIETATRGEWEEFESGYAAGAEEWLLAHGDHPEAGEVRARLDAHRAVWLRGYRDVWGFAYLTLGVPHA